MYRYIFLILFSLSFQGAKSQKSFVQQSGDFLQIAMPAGTLAATFIYASNDKPYWQFTKSFATSIVTTQLLKRLIHKQRPDHSDYLSFPSGHTTAAFSSAAFLQFRYGWKVGIPALLLASYVGYSRIYANRHDIWDVLAGAGIGIAGAYLFTKPYNNKNLGFNVSHDNHYFVLQFNYTF